MNIDIRKCQSLHFLYFSLKNQKKKSKITKRFAFTNYVLILSRIFPTSFNISEIIPNDEFTHAP
jgi:hypothetical protein